MLKQTSTDKLLEAKTKVKIIPTLSTLYSVALLIEVCLLTAIRQDAAANNYNQVFLSPLLFPS
jgi:hypothetical protein